MARATIPTVSVIMGTYNSEKFIGLQIQSILNQSYTDFELLISDDASSDKTPVILKQFARRDARIRLTLRKKNVGMSENYTQMVERAAGSFVAFSDHDDIWRPHKIEQQLHFLLTHPKVGLCYHDSYVIDEHASITHGSLQSFVHGRSSNASPSKRDTLAKLVNTNHILGNSIFCKKSILHTYLPIPDRFPPDHWVVLVASCFSSVGYVDDKLSHYRRHTENSWQDYKLSLRQKILKLRSSDYVSQFLRNLRVLHSTLQLLLKYKPPQPKAELLNNQIRGLDFIISITNESILFRKLNLIASSIRFSFLHRQYNHLLYLSFILLSQMIGTSIRK